MLPGIVSAFELCSSQESAQKFSRSCRGIGAVIRFGLVGSLGVTETDFCCAARLHEYSPNRSTSSARIIFGSLICGLIDSNVLFGFCIAAVTWCGAIHLCQNPGECIAGLNGILEVLRFGARLVLHVPILLGALCQIPSNILMSVY